MHRSHAIRIETDTLIVASALMGQSNAKYYRQAARYSVEGGGAVITISTAAASRRVRMGALAINTQHLGWPRLVADLSALGRRDGQTLEVVDRQAEGDTSKLPRLAAEIVAARPE